VQQQQAILPPPAGAPPQAAPARAPGQAAPPRSDGFVGQPTTTAIVGDRGVANAEDLPAKHHCVMCTRGLPGSRIHMSWECVFKLQRKAQGEPCPGFDVMGNRDPAAWDAGGNLTAATVAAWRSYIDRWGLTVAKSAPGPARLS